MSRFANLSTRLSADLPKGPTRPDEDEEDDCNADREEGTKKKDKPMADNTVSAEEHASALADAAAKATQAANARFSAVLASDEYKGREALANNLLGNAALDADTIISALAAAPKAEKSSSEGDEGARSEMKNAIDRNANSGIVPAKTEGADEAEGPSATVVANGWAAAMSRANQLAGY